VLSILLLLGSVGAVLLAVERGLFRGRLIVALFLVVSVGTMLLVSASGARGFLVVAAGALPFLLGLVIQEMNDTVGVLAASRRRNRPRKRPRRRPHPDWWIPAEARARERERDRLAA
jgi:hypothetical protein